jgi:methionyl-tRNA formyltransferase
VNIVLVAEEAAGIQTLRAIVATENRLVGVLTTDPSRGGGATVRGVAEGLGVETRPSELVREPETAEWLREQDVDLLLNVHSLYVIHPEVVRAPRVGAFNLHPGPLPEYAGLNAPSWAIYNGEASHGVTVHWMEPEIDTGAVAYAARFDLTDDDTGLSVSVRCVREGVPLVERLLADAAADAASIPRIQQDLSRRRYYRRGEVPDDGKLVWDRPARQVTAFVRACDYFPFPSPWGHPVGYLDDRELAVLKATTTGEPTQVAEPGTVGEAVGDAVPVAAGDEWVLVQRVQLDGGARPAAEVLAEGARLR